MADEITLKLDPRTTIGKKVKSLRRTGIIPVHLYGPGTSPRSLQCQGPELITALAQAGRNTPISIAIEGEGDEHLAFVREIQRDPLRGDLLHVDFLKTVEAPEAAEAEQAPTAEAAETEPEVQEQGEEG